MMNCIDMCGKDLKRLIHKHEYGIVDREFYFVFSCLIVRGFYEYFINFGR